MQTRTYEFVIYDELAEHIDTQLIDFMETSQARSKAGRLAKKHGGRVDLAWVDDRKLWEDRYITTASPSEYHQSGYRFERIC